MATATYTGNLAYYDGSSWTSGATAQGRYGSALRHGVVKWYGNLKGKQINSVTLTVTSSVAGNPATDTKTAYIYHSNYQEINTAVTGAAHRGSYIGKVSGKFYNNTVTLDGACLKDMLVAGENTFCLYVSEDNQSGFSWSKNYFKWTVVTITVDWEQPQLTAPTSITPAYGTLSYYYKQAPTITWGSASGAVSYTIERAVSNDIHLDTWSVIKTGITGTSYTDNGNYTIGSSNAMALGDYVRYRIKAVDPDGKESAYVYTGNIRRMLPQDTPVGLTAVVARNSVTLKWSGETADFARYRISYNVNGGASLTTTVTNTSWTHNTSTLADASAISYRVRFEQQSPEDATIINSAYTNAVVVRLWGGVRLKTASGYKQGLIWKNVGQGYKLAKRIWIKATTWRRST